ncbi:DUF2798 domain-containing protein [Acinetobacter johnsonii]|uniref:DUF2798 domain-containing protein n=1 Tax=Acinetobacter johnsonii TaxID=40214 RepID=UPI003D1668A5
MFNTLPKIHIKHLNWLMPLLLSGLMSGSISGFNLLFSVHDKFHRTLILSGFCLLKIAKISLNSSFFPKPIKR